MINLAFKPTLIGEKVMLRPFEIEDIEPMEQCLRDPEVIKLTGSFGELDMDVVRNWYRTRNEQPDRLDLAIVDKSNQLVVGEVVVNEYDANSHSMNFRILIGPRGRDRGLGSEATALIIDYVFATTELQQLTLSVYAFNPRAIRVYEKAGFVLDSIDVGELEYEGSRVDSLNMVLTRERREKKRNAARS